MTRRDFLKLCCVAAAGLMLGWRRQQQAQAAITETETEAQIWSFPLAFPAYFAPNADRPLHRQYLPLITSNG
jgi:hypothetical protein